MDSPPSESEWNKERLKDLLYDKGEVDNPQSFAQFIIRAISTDVQKADPERLAVHIYQRGLTSYNQFELLTSRHLTEQEKSRELLKLLNQAATAFNPVRNINELYLALLDSCEEDVGLGGHYEIARSLRLQVLAALKIDASFHERDVKELSTVITKLKSCGIQERTGHLLRQNLGLGRVSNQKQLEDVKEIVQEWYHSTYPTCTLADLVKGLMCTPGLGRLVSRLVPLCFSNTMIVRILIRNLREYWKVFASYIGFTREEIHSIEQSSCGTPGAHNVTFLRVWWMPDCGSSTQSILEEVRKLAKIPLWRPQSNDAVQDVQHGVSLTGQSQNVAVQVNNNYAVYYMIHPETVESDTPMRPQGLGSQPQTPMLLPRPPVGPPVNGEATPGSHNNRNDEVVRDGPVSPSPREPHKGGGVNELKGQLSKEPYPNNMERCREPRTTLPKSMDQLKLSEGKSVPKWHPAPYTAAPQNGCEKKLTKYEQATLPKSVDNVLGVGREVPKWQRALSTTAPKTVEGKGFLKACVEGDWEAASAFLESGSYLEERDDEGRTPLMHACKKKKTDIVVKLLQEGADFTDLDKNGHCCLHFPETLKNTELAKLLIGAYRRKGCSVDLAAVDNNYTPLMVACTIGDVVYPTTELLLKNGANPDGNADAQYRPLIEASARGYIRLVRLLLQYKANTDITDQSGSTALLQAINCHQVEIAFLLLDKGVNVNRQDHTETTPLFSAVTSNSYELVEKLIDKGANIDASRFMNGPISVGTMGDGTVEETPLAHACARGFLKIVELLIQKGADMNYLCSGTVPPLGFAIMLKQMHVVSFLMEHSGLDQTITGLSGPIIIAVKVENLRCAKMMLERLGGVSEALWAANRNQMYQLVEHIGIYKAVVESVPDSSFEENDPDPIQARLQSAEHSKFEATIHRFCQICVAAVVNNPNIPQDVLISCATAIAGSEVADFFSRCFKNMQRQNTLRQEFLSGNPSPSRFLIDNRMLTEVDFQTQALHFYPEGTESFFSDLVKAFQQLPGGHTLPNNARAVLHRFFSGQFQVGCQIGLLGARGATYLPEIPCEVSSYGHSHWQQTTPETTPIAVSTDSGSSYYTPMIDGVPIRRSKQLPPRGDTVVPPDSTAGPHDSARSEAVDVKYTKSNPEMDSRTTESDTSTIASDSRAHSSTWAPEPYQESVAQESVAQETIAPPQIDRVSQSHEMPVHPYSNENLINGGTNDLHEGSPESEQQEQKPFNRTNSGQRVTKLRQPGWGRPKSSAAQESDHATNPSTASPLTEKKIIPDSKQGSHSKDAVVPTTEQQNDPSVGDEMKVLRPKRNTTAAPQRTRANPFQKSKPMKTDVLGKISSQQTGKPNQAKHPEHRKMSARGEDPVVPQKVPPRERATTPVRQKREPQRAIRAEQDKKKQSKPSHLANNRTPGAIMASILPVLMKDRDLRPSLMEGATHTGRVLGRGAYGHVLELEHNGSFYAGKVFRGDVKTDKDFCDMFIAEYKILAKLSNHHIVKYSGICALDISDLPLLVMEKMECSLHDYLLEPEKTLDLARELELLLGVAKGLVYLHSHCVIHRDLTAKNVLLDKDGVPKISDFGNSKVVPIDPGTGLYSITTPGTHPYMPSEAFTGNKKGNTALDVFSFGHLGLFVSTQVFPNELLAATYKEGRERKARTEVQRREKYFNELEQKHPNHPITPLIEHCLEDEMEDRPSSASVQGDLEDLQRNHT